MTDLKPNAELAYKVLDHIDTNPETWRQKVWAGKSECGTAACFAGWAVMLSGHTVEIAEDGGYESIDGNRDITIAGVAAEELRIDGLVSPCRENHDSCTWSETYTDRLFDASNTREELGELVLEFFGPRPVTDAPRDDACRAIAADLDHHPDGP